MSKKIKKYIKIWYSPVMIFIFSLLLIMLVATEHYYYFENLEKSANLFIGGFITLVATMVGVFTPLNIQRKWQEQSEKRKMIFALTAVWDEFRAKLEELKQDLERTLESTNKAICEIEKTLARHGVKVEETKA